MRSVLACRLSPVQHCGMTCFDGAQGPCCEFVPAVCACRATDIWDHRLVPASNRARLFTTELRCRYCQMRKSAGDMTVARTSSQARVATAAFTGASTSSSTSTSSNRTSTSSTVERSFPRDTTDNSEARGFLVSQSCEVSGIMPMSISLIRGPVRVVIDGGSVPTVRASGTARRADGPANELCYALLSAGRCCADSDGLLPCSAAASRQLFRTACNGPPLCTAEVRPHRLCRETDSRDRACNKTAGMLHYTHGAMVAMQRWWCDRLT